MNLKYYNEVEYKKHLFLLGGQCDLYEKLWAREPKIF